MGVVTSLYCKVYDVTAAPPVIEGAFHVTDIELTPCVVMNDEYGGGSGVVAGIALEVVENRPDNGPYPVPLSQYPFTAAT